MRPLIRARGLVGIISFLSAAALIWTASPAAAAGDSDLAAEAVIEGDVTVPQGVPLGLTTGPHCTGSIVDGVTQDDFQGIPTTFSFDQTVISGALTVTRGTEEMSTAVGTIEVTAEGNDSCDSTALGVGEVEITKCDETNDPNLPDNVIVADSEPANVGQIDVGTIDCLAQGGEYIRVGPHVIVTLAGTTVLEAPNHDPYEADTTVVVAAEFGGPATDDNCGGGADNCIKNAQFAGTFESNSVA